MVRRPPRAVAHVRPLLVLKGSLAAVVLALNTVIVFSAMIPGALLKLVLPFAPVRHLVDPMLNALATSWVSLNGVWMDLVGRIRWDVQGRDGLRPDRWYVVTSNHQSWVDILVLQRIFNRRVPMLKFFLKHELLYVPVIGLAWWALDFPFMKRQGAASSLQDLDRARKACEKFKLVPTSVFNFLEGTRSSAAKRAAQRSPYRHLLKPKIGGLATALATLGTQVDTLLDVTIVYPGAAPSFWALLNGTLEAVTVRVDQVTIPVEFLSAEAMGNPRHRVKIQRWVEERWRMKDALIEAMDPPVDATLQATGA